MIYLLLAAELSPYALKSTGLWDHLQENGPALPNRLREKTAMACNQHVTIPPGSHCLLSENTGDCFIRIPAVGCSFV